MLTKLAVVSGMLLPLLLLVSVLKMPLVPLLLASVSAALELLLELLLLLLMAVSALMLRAMATRLASSLDPFLVLMSVRARRVWVISGWRQLGAH